MNAPELRGVLSWWMMADRPPTGEPDPADDAAFEWLDKECRAQGYDGIVDAYHRHLNPNYVQQVAKEM